MPFVPYYMAVRNRDGSEFDCIVYDPEHFMDLFRHDAMKIWVSEYGYPDIEEDEPAWVREGYE